MLDRELIRLTRDPGRFTREVDALPARTWVVVDEVQRLPALLNEGRDLIARRGTRHRFALTGSSARQLERSGANLLPGRVVNRRFFPLTAGELGYWRTASGNEVDFVWSRGQAAVGLEAKAASRWRRGDAAALTELHATRRLCKCFGVYLGRESLRDGPVSVLPLARFLRALAGGEILG